jgi:hypothetical protein
MNRPKKLCNRRGHEPMNDVPAAHETREVDHSGARIPRRQTRGSAAALIACSVVASATADDPAARAISSKGCTKAQSRCTSDTIGPEWSQMVRCVRQRGHSKSCAEGGHTFYRTTRCGPRSRVAGAVQNRQSGHAGDRLPPGTSRAERLPGPYNGQR